ncbi:MAG: hypothetical protein JWP65_1258 [Ramlibacter sp.]|jgi:hypothetical protein|nr:hypothetical protein [Ramlibacter sp.]
MRPQALQQMRERSDRHGFGRQPRRRWCPACIRRARGRSRPQRLRGGLPDGPGGMLWRRAAARDPRRAGSGGASRSGRREELVFGSERAPRFKRWNLPAARCRRPAAAAVTSRHAPRGTPLNLQSAHKRHPVARPPQAAAHAGAVEHSPIRVTGSQQKHRARLRSGCFAPTAPAPARRQGTAGCRGRLRRPWSSTSRSLPACHPLWTSSDAAFCHGVSPCQTWQEVA